MNRMKPRAQVEIERMAPYTTVYCATRAGADNLIALAKRAKKRLDIRVAPPGTTGGWLVYSNLTKRRRHDHDPV